MPQPKREQRNDAEWTPANFAAAANLRRIWNEKARTLNLTQNKVARQHGISQVAICNYLNGIIRLNPHAVLRFAQTLQVIPHAIDQRMHRLMRLARTNYDHAIALTSNDYAPRFLKDDLIVIDPLNSPKDGGLCVAYNSDNVTLGYFTATGLEHPNTQELQPIEAMMVHPVAHIIPKGRL